MQEKDFFKLEDGRQARLYTLKNGNGFQVDVTDMGGCIVNLIAPDREGRPVDVALGHADPAAYEENIPYFGALVGRVANRIKGARFTLDGKEYRLVMNESDKGNTLHGGNSFGRRLWNARRLDDSAVSLSLSSPHMDSGFPGNLAVAVTYRVAEDNSLEIAYSATCDAPTFVNLTNHAYFNLNGADAGEYGSHTVQSSAYAHTEVDANLAPTGAVPSVDGTPYDLRNGRTFEEILADARLPIAFDDNFVVAPQAGVFRKEVFKVRSERTGITLSLDTDQPGVQFYMGYWMDGIPGKHGTLLERYSGFCLEAQLWPDAPNHPDFPSALLVPGGEYTQRTVYRFGVE